MNSDCLILEDLCHDHDNPIDCNEHGYCENTNDNDIGYICLCEPGWAGDNCEEGKHTQKFYIKQ